MRRLLLGVGILGALIGVYVVADALVVSDEELLEAIANDFQGTVSTAAIDQALTHFAPDKRAVEVNARGLTRVYGNSAAADLRRDALRGLRRVNGTTIRRLRTGITVDGDRGKITMQLMSDQGMANVELHVDRVEERWIVTRFQATR
ncbi:MAG: hypothetical protein AAGE52_02440 [Myxococcota bacterium]